MHCTRLLLLISLLTGVASAQKKPEAEKPLARSTATLNLAGAKEPEIDTQAIVKETEFVDTRSHKMGIFWWVPVEFWQLSMIKQGFSREQANKAFASFKDYNLFLVAVGDFGIGNVSWLKPEELKGRLVLRDQHGNAYQPIEEIPEEVAFVVNVMKPTLKNMLGNLGEGTQFVLFAAKDGKGTVFADPHRSGEMSLDVSEIMGVPTRTYTWRLPLTSLNPPKFCSVGKEKVEASWKYCPWHGNKLEDAAGTTETPSSAEKH